MAKLSIRWTGTIIVREPEPEGYAEKSRVEQRENDLARIVISTKISLCPLDTGYTERSEHICADDGFRLKTVGGKRICPNAAHPEGYEPPDDKIQKRYYPGGPSFIGPVGLLKCKKSKVCEGTVVHARNPLTSCLFLRTRYAARPHPKHITSYLELRQLLYDAKAAVFINPLVATSVPLVALLHPDGETDFMTLESFVPVAERRTSRDYEKGLKMGEVRVRAKPDPETRRRLQALIRPLTPEDLIDARTAKLIEHVEKK